MHINPLVYQLTCELHPTPVHAHSVQAVYVLHSRCLYLAGYLSLQIRL